MRSKTFYHYDTLRGANYEHAKPLVKELLQQIHQTNSPNLDKSLIKRHDIRQGNGWDCGVAVIAIMRRIIELSTDNSWTTRLKYGSFRCGDDLGRFDFGKEREKLRNKYLIENNL